VGPVEQEKRIKYGDLVANAVMLHNVVDMTKVLATLQQEGVEVTPDVAKCLSPYLTEHLKRFGQYILDVRSAGHYRLGGPSRWRRDPSDTGLYGQDGAEGRRPRHASRQ
jgi:hypothetical protein